MEKDKHDDKLESYIRNSFEDYEESPRDDMWAGIADALPPTPPVHPLTGFWKNYGWQLVAASVIVVLVARLLFVQSYYESQLKIAKQQKAPAQASQPDQTSGTATIPSELKIAPDANNQQKSSVIKGGPESGIEAPESNIQPGNTINNPSSTQETIAATPNQTPQQFMAEGEKPLQPTESVDKASEPGKPIFENNTTEANATQTLALLPAPVSDVASLNTRATALPLAEAPMIKPYKAPSGWYAGLAITPFWAQDKQPEMQSFGPRSLVSNAQEDPQFVLNLSARVGRSFGKYFALESGLGYQHLTRTAVHNPKFEYRDGHPGGGPGHHGMRSFEYDLNTYSGSASVSLRTEVVGSNTPGDDEPVRAKIESTENMDMVQIPLSAVGRFGNGKLKVMFKAGLVGNILVKNTLDITAYRLDNPNLSVQPNDGFTVQLEQPTKFIAGYQLAAGLDYFLTPNLSLSLAPTFAGDFPREEGARPWGHRLPGMTAFGLQLGSNYWF